MNSQNYWKNREAKHIEKMKRADVNRNKEIEKRIELARKQIQTEIDAAYRRYASKEGISISDVHKRVSKADVEALSSKAKVYSKQHDFSARANYEMKLYNLTMRVSRLELIKAELGLELIDMTNDLDKYLKSELKNVSLDELRRNSGIMSMTVDERMFGKMIESIVDGSFATANFSDNIWKYHAELKAELDKLLIKSFTQGENPRVLARELRKSFDVTKNQAERLMRTETARVQIEVQKYTYEEGDIKRYGFVAESNACSICKAVESKGPYLVSKMETGENAPPMHPNCRCSTYPEPERDELEAMFKSLGK